jgi:hypothetical protein
VPGPGAARLDRASAGPSATAPERRYGEPPEAESSLRAADRSAGTARRPVPVDEAALARRARAMRGVFAATLALEALTVLLVPRAIAQFGPGLTAWRLGLLLGLAGSLLLAALSQRRRWGVPLGTALQAGIIATGVLIASMYVLGAVSAGVWAYLLWLRRDLLADRRHPGAAAGPPLDHADPGG